MKKKANERKIRRKVIYQGKILDLYVDQIKISDGSRSIREVISHAPAVAMVPLLSGERVVLIQQYRYAIGRMLWEIPAGLVDANETPRQAAIRELREETGFRARRLRLMVNMYSSPGYCQEKIYIYLAQDLSKVADLQLDADEFLSVLIVPFRKALRMITTGEIVDGKTILGLLLAAESIKK
ncbi:NUDIX hydrolase [bacterium]|nr:NUDIX hydrolase [bacterium]